MTKAKCSILSSGRREPEVTSIVSSLRFVAYALVESHLGVRRGQYDCPVKRWLDKFPCGAADSGYGESHSSALKGSIVEDCQLMKDSVGNAACHELSLTHSKKRKSVFYHSMRTARLDSTPTIRTSSTGSRAAAVS
jgi:hypothetical protein